MSEHETYTDNRGVLRYKTNKVVRHLIDNTDLNELWAHLYRNGHITQDDECTKGGPWLEDMKEVYRMMGYSLCGFADIFDVYEGEEDETKS